MRVRTLSHNLLVRTNNHAHPKVYKSCCHKTTWAAILMSPSHLLEARGAPVFASHQGAWITVGNSFSKSSSVHVYITVKLSLCSLELDFNLFATSWGSGLFFVKYALKSPVCDDVG